MDWGFYMIAWDFCAENVNVVSLVSDKETGMR